MQIIAKVGYKGLDETAQNKFTMFTQYIRKEMNNFMAKNAKLSSISDTLSEMRVSGSKSNGDFSHFHMLKH